MTLALLREVVERVRPPRALWVPYPHGYPLGRPHDRELQQRVLRSALALFAAAGPPPVLASYAPDDAPAAR